MIYETTDSPAKTGGKSTWNLQNLRELIDKTCLVNADRVAYMVKDKKGGDYRDIKYSEFQKDVEAVGTALLASGISQKYFPSLMVADPPRTLNFLPMRSSVQDRKSTV